MIGQRGSVFKVESDIVIMLPVRAVRCPRKPHSVSDLSDSSEAARDISTEISASSDGTISIFPTSRFGSWRTQQAEYSRNFLAITFLVSIYGTCTHFSTFCDFRFILIAHPLLKPGQAGEGFRLFGS